MKHRFQSPLQHQSCNLKTAKTLSKIYLESGLNHLHFQTFQLVSRGVPEYLRHLANFKNLKTNSINHTLAFKVISGKGKPVEYLYLI